MTEIWNINVVDDQDTHSNHDGEDSDEPYSYRGTTSTSHDIKGFHASKGKRDYRDFLVDFEPQYGLAYFLLYAVYSTGDSFGHDNGRGIEYYGLFKPDEIEKAKSLMDALKKNEKEYSIVVDGKTYHCPWTGYFESLDEMEIKPVLRLVK